MKFWKVGSCKVFTVLEGKGSAKMKTRNRKNSSLSSDESDDENRILMRKIDSMHMKMSRVLDINNRISLPLGFCTIVNEAFKCTICLVNKTPQVIVGKCCKRIIGCQKCVDTWYQGDDRMTKRCPLCQGPRGFGDTMGIEEFLTTLINLSSGSGSLQVKVPPVSVQVPSLPPTVDLPDFSD